MRQALTVSNELSVARELSADREIVSAHEDFLLSAVMPELVPPAAGVLAAQGDDACGTLGGPVHAGLPATLARDFACRLPRWRLIPCRAAGPPPARHRPGR